jgi:hypothetical protein
MRRTQREQIRSVVSLCLSQKPPMVGLRAFGNSFPLSSVGTHPMSLTAAVRPEGGEHYSVVILWRGASVW